MIVNRCINCGSRVFDDGFCGEVNCNSYYSQWDKTCAPAQEEKEMKTPDRCAKCPSVLMQHEEVMCSRCRDKEDALTADLRERWDRAYYAALTGYCAMPPIPGVTDHQPIDSAQWIATETIRRHAELMASRDAAIAEVVG